MNYQEFFKGFVESKKKEGCQGATAIFMRSYHLPWVIERIENSNCDHKWCEIVRDKLAEEDEDEEVL